MKFGASLKHLEISEWEDNYVSYNTIKKLLKPSADSKQKAVFGETEEEEFVTQLDSELEKTFHSQQMEEIRQSIEKCATQIDALARLDQGSKEPLQLEAYAKKVNHLADWINKLSSYAQVNYTAVIKLVKKHDRHVSYRVRPLFMIRLKQCQFWKQDYEPLLLQLSELFRIIRSEVPPIGILNSSNIPEQHATEQFIRKSTKYIVTLDNILELKTFILRHLPMLVYDNTQRRSNKPINPPITSIYLDNSDLELYNAKVDKEDGAQVIRLRWYGSTKDTKKIYVERKIQQEEDKGELKDRFMLKEKYIKDYLDGKKDGIQKAASKIKSQNINGAQEEADAFENLALELQDVIKSKNLQPGEYLQLSSCFRHVYQLNNVSSVSYILYPNSISNSW
ncbi:unnamed protein product [Umbelopsis sp. WA50703]